MSMNDVLANEVRKLSKQLLKGEHRIVFAESCTGGLLATHFTAVPGASDFFCGSHVVYRLDSKKQWLGVRSATLRKFSAVSAECAEEMVRGALRTTKEATVAASITGYLGPAGEHVGQVFISVLLRGSSSPITLQLDLESPLTQNLRKTPRKRWGISPLEKRLFRRELAALATVFLVRSSLKI